MKGFGGGLHTVAEIEICPSVGEEFGTSQNESYFVDRNIPAVFEVVAVGNLLYFGVGKGECYDGAQNTYVKKHCHRAKEKVAF